MSDGMNWEGVWAHYKIDAPPGSTSYEVADVRRFFERMYPLANASGGQVILPRGWSLTGPGLPA